MGRFVIVEFFNFSLPPSQSVDCTGDYETLCAIEGTIHPVESLQRHYAFRRNETLDKSTELLVERALFKEKWASVISRKETKSVFPFVSFRLGDKQKSWDDLFKKISRSFSLPKSNA